MITRSHERGARALRLGDGVEMLCPSDTLELVLNECRRLGQVPSDLDATMHLADGWPMLARALAFHARVVGTSPSGRALADLAPECVTVLGAMWRQLPVRARARLLLLSCAAEGIAADDAGDTPTLGVLVDRGLVVIGNGRARTRRFVAVWAAEHAPSGPMALARRKFAARVLTSAEHASSRHRAAPIEALAALDAAWPDLRSIALHGAPPDALRAALALEPLIRGRLERDDAMAIWDRARSLPATRAVSSRVALGLARTLLGRGDHESAETILEGLRVHGPATARAFAHVYLGHIQAWRGALELARADLHEVERALTGPLARSSEAEAIRQDLWVQQMFVAHQAHLSDEVERLARRAVEHARRTPAPRLGAIARRFTAEALLRRGAAARAVPLFARSRDELAAQGEAAGANFTTSRLVEALRAAGEHARAEEEAERAARAAARADEATLEMALVDAGHSARQRVVEVAWRAQIPAIRRRAEAWLERQAPTPAPSVLRLDPQTCTASLSGKTMALARRPTLWRLLLALTDRRHGVALSSDALFEAGWPRDRARQASRRQRVQTAIWTLRRSLLGDALTTTAAGYALESELGVTRD